MNFYPFHIGDYLAHTAHLDALEDLAYRRLLDLYYLREAPIPADVQEAARLIRMRDHLECVEAVLREFFAPAEDGWRHDRCEEELSRMRDRQAKARASAAASVRARQARQSDRSTDAQRSLSERSANVELPIPIPIPIPTPISSTTSLRSVVVSRPNDVPEDVWRDFLALRRAKRAPLTPKAFDGVKREAAKAGLSITEALTICIERGWQSFQASWHQNTALRGPAPEKFAAKDYGAGGDI